MWHLRSPLLAWALLVSSLYAAAKAELKEVTSLPGLSEKLCFKSYAGYVSAATPDKHLFAWYVEASESPETKPVVLWLNGGPGCSSLGGMWGELGPFLVNKDHTVSLNPYSWNTAANMIFIEQPAGVGFSYPAVDTNDEVTAKDTYQAIMDVFAAFSLKDRPFYIFGESYGGHYVPNTVQIIRDGNNDLKPGDSKIINIKGFGVGNGYTDWALDFQANVPYAVAHGLCSYDQYAEANRACKGSFAACFWPREGFPCSDECSEAVAAVTNTAMNPGNMDMYDIYEDICLEGQERIKTDAFVFVDEQRKAQRNWQQQKANAKTGSNLGTTPIAPIYPTCTDAYTQTYLSREDVQKAIGARRITTWNQCALLNNGSSTPMTEGKQYEFNFESRISYYETWAAEAKLDMLVYSGDADFIVNFMGTQNWLNASNLNKVRDWVPWTGSDGQTAGFLTDYWVPEKVSDTQKTGVKMTDDDEGGVRFVTVKGAGHMVPKDRPAHALDLFKAYLEKIPLDKIPKSDFQGLCGKPPPSPNPSPSPPSSDCFSSNWWAFLLTAIGGLALGVVIMGLVGRLAPGAARERLRDPNSVSLQGSA